MTTRNVSLDRQLGTVDYLVLTVTLLSCCETHFFQYHVLCFIIVGLPIFHVCLSGHLYDGLKGKRKDGASVVQTVMDIAQGAALSVLTIRTYSRRENALHT